MRYLLCIFLCVVPTFILFSGCILGPQPEPPDVAEDSARDQPSSDTSEPGDLDDDRDGEGPPDANWEDDDSDGCSTCADGGVDADSNGLGEPFYHDPTTRTIESPVSITDITGNADGGAFDPSADSGDYCDSGGHRSGDADGGVDAGADEPRDGALTR